MCGINYSKIRLKINKFNFKNYIEKVKNSIKLEDLNSAIKIIKKFRNNFVFIEIIRENKILINELKEILSLIINLRMKNNFKQFDYLNDLQWIIESELFFKTKRIIEFLKKNKIKISPKSIVFVRFFLYNIESINYLESRGRDSLGVSINFIFKNKLNFKTKINNGNNFNIFYKVFKKYSFLNITAKYSKRIGFSKENSTKILNLFSKKLQFNKINFEDLMSFEIYSHTRWASVGDVTNSNAHPLINVNNNNLNISIMNGDINNYQDIRRNLINRKKFYLNDSNCNNDLQIIPSLFYTDKKKINNIAEGSFVLFNFDSSNVDQFSIYKKGSQGLYYTLDEDKNIHFASDLYGLINKSEKFRIIKNDGLYIINKKFLKKINKLEFQKTDLSTIDLSLKGKESYFLKEIGDTSTFLKRTLNKYIDFQKNEIIGFENLFNQNFKNKLITRKIKNIIFTGMGSCYTAAVGISKYLNYKINSEGYHDMKVEATIASEGSGFYLKNNMSDTVIVVIAQSGTTIDTNVFAKMAKDRGAYTVAIVNKKQGDVTYIVDQSFYLGNGRDVEISVPSTKTYTCHLITGFILAEKILEMLSKKINLKFINTLKSIFETNFIESSLTYLSHQIEKINIDILKFNNWVVVYDDSITSFSALELRIKLSECCYKSIPYISLNNFNKMGLKKTLVFSLSSLKNLKLNNSNFYISMTNSKNLKNNRNFYKIKLKSNYFINQVIEKSIALQLLAYKVAKIIDHESHDKNKISKNLNKITNFILDKKNLLKFEKLNTKIKINTLQDKLKRPIDVIKHQAKTVTVGAIRSINIDDVNNLDGNPLQKSLTIPKFKFAFKSLKKKINIISNDLYDYEKYYVGNIIEYCNNEFNTDKHYKFPYKKIKENLKNYTNIKILNRKLEISNLNKKLINFNFNSHDLLKFFIQKNKKTIHNEIIFQNCKKYLIENKSKYEIKLEEIINNFNNVKFLGSGINYLIAKKYAQKFSKIYKKTIAFDVIENHKHIDISSEALLIIFASNIDRKGFQRDVFSELEKFIAHDNEPIIFTNIGNNIFDNLINLKNSFSDKRIIKLPLIPEIYSPSIFDFYFDRFIN